MEKNRKILLKIESYYKKKFKEISTILNIKEDYILDLEKNDNKLKIVNKKNNKIIITGKYNFHGVILNNNIWVWGSSIPGVNQKIIKNINRIRSFSYLFENDTHPRVLFYHQLLTQNMLLITDNKYIDWINKLLIYLNNDIYFFNPTNSKNNLQFITISKVLEKYV